MLLQGREQGAFLLLQGKEQGAFLLLQGRAAVELRMVDRVLGALGQAGLNAGRRFTGIHAGPGIPISRSSAPRKSMGNRRHRGFHCRRDRPPPRCNWCIEGRHQNGFGGSVLPVVTGARLSQHHRARPRPVVDPGRICGLYLYFYEATKGAIGI